MRQEYENRIIQLKVDCNEEKREKDARIAELVAERDACLQRLDFFASVPEKISALYSNLSNLSVDDPMNRRQLSSLLSTIQSITNSVSVLNSSPSFALYVNNTKVTNDAIISIGDSRTLIIRVKNLSSFTAENLTVRLSAPLNIDPTNIIATGWRPMPPDMLGGRDEFLTGLVIGNSWEWRAERPQGSGLIYNCDFLKIATNLVLPIQVKLGAYASRSKMDVFLLTLQP